MAGLKAEGDTPGRVIEDYPSGTVEGISAALEVTTNLAYLQDSAYEYLAYDNH